MNICTLVKSCKKEKRLWSKIIENHPSKIYIYYGNENIEENVISGKNIILKCDDSWQGLRQKNTQLWKFISSSKILNEYTHFFVIDFPESLYHSKRIYSTLRNLEIKFCSEQNKNKKYYFLDKNVNPRYNNFHVISMNDCHYLSDVAFAEHDDNNFSFRTSYYHIGKTPKENPLSSAPIDGPLITFTPGSGTLFSIESMKKISLFVSDKKNNNLINTFYGGLHEDILAGYILASFDIYPSIFPFNIYMRNFDNNFPELKKEFIKLFEKNNQSQLDKYIDIFRENYVGKDNHDYINDQTRTKNLLKLINEIGISDFSVDSLTLQLIILIQNEDSKKFNLLVKKIINRGSKKISGFNENIMILGRLILSNKLFNFYKPLLQLINSYFPEYNFKYFLQSEIFKNEKNFKGMHKVLGALNKISNHDAEIYKFRLLDYLIENDFNESLNTYLNSNYDLFLSKVVKINFYLKKKDYTKSIKYFNKLKPKSKTQHLRKQRLSLVISKETNNPSICTEALKTISAIDKSSEKIKANIIIYLCQNGKAEICRKYLIFSTNQFCINLCKSLYLESRGKMNAAIDELRNSNPVSGDEKLKKYFFLSKLLFDIDFDVSKKYAYMYSEMVDRLYKFDDERNKKKEIYLNRYK